MNRASSAASTDALSAWSTRWISRLTTSSSERPVDRSWWARFWSARSACSAAVAPASSPPASSGSCAETKTKCPDEMPEEAAPSGGGATADRMACLLMA